MAYGQLCRLRAKHVLKLFHQYLLICTESTRWAHFHLFFVAGNNVELDRSINQKVKDAAGQIKLKVQENQYQYNDVILNDGHQAWFFH